MTILNNFSHGTFAQNAFLLVRKSKNFGKMSGIFAPFSKDFLRLSKFGLYLTPKNAIFCH
eukprot:UN25101